MEIFYEEEKNKNPTKKLTLFRKQLIYLCYLTLPQNLLFKNLFAKCANSIIII